MLRTLESLIFLIVDFSSTDTSRKIMSITCILFEADRMYQSELRIEITIIMYDI
jgi:hypothetical protein